MVYWNPIQAASLQAMVERIPLREGMHILDIGCGRARLLLDLVEASGGVGVGVDPHEQAIRGAHQEAMRRGLDARVDLTLAPFDAAVHAKEPYDLVLALGSSHAIGGFPDAWSTLQDIIAPGGHLLLGEGYWRQTPPESYLEFLGCAADDMHTFEETANAEQASGFTPVARRAATQEEWDAYEDTYARNLFGFVEDHPDDPDAESIFTRINAWRDAYLKWGRATLGFGLFLLERKKPPSP